MNRPDGSWARGHGRTSAGTPLGKTFGPSPGRARPKVTSRGRTGMRTPADSERKAGGGGKGRLRAAALAKTFRREARTYLLPRAPLRSGTLAEVREWRCRHAPRRSQGSLLVDSPFQRFQSRARRRGWHAKLAVGLRHVRFRALRQPEIEGAKIGWVPDRPRAGYWSVFHARPNTWPWTPPPLRHTPAKRKWNSMEHAEAFGARSHFTSGCNRISCNVTVSLGSHDACQRILPPFIPSIDWSHDRMQRR